MAGHEVPRGPKDHQATFFSSSSSSSLKYLLTILFLLFFTGRSHNTTYILYRIGQLANPALKSFAETGKTEALDEQSQGADGIFDEFSAPAITSGSGRTETEFFVDGNHSHVSIVSRLVPSPDWFIGLDSFNLCVDGNWVDSLTVEVDPLDAGTNNGFTFTAPNWPTDPPGTIYKITSKYPSHRAGSFYYPYMKRLPAIATFQFIKVRIIIHILPSFTFFSH